MIQIKEVEQNDINGQLIMKWRNDIDTRNNSYNNNLFEWNDFRNIFYEKYFAHTIPPLFALYENTKVCFIGCRDTDIKYDIEISINLDPKFRNKQLSSKIIKSTILYIKTNYPLINNIVAEIKIDNVASNKTFIKNNFKHITTKTIKNNIMNVYNYNMNQLVQNFFQLIIEQ